jgi:hypothetical protein
LKRGFTFFHHTFDQPFNDDAQHRNQLLVAASPNDRVADTHWYRPDFDAFLVSERRSSESPFSMKWICGEQTWRNGARYCRAVIAVSHWRFTLS